MIIIDASALVGTLVYTEDYPALVARVAHGSNWHAPQLLDLEFLSSMRSLIARQEISASRAAKALIDFDEMGIRLYPHTLLLEKVWVLRHNFTPYDAAYIALSEIFDVPLITLDRALESDVHSAQVEVF